MEELNNNLRLLEKTMELIRLMNESNMTWLSLLQTAAMDPIGERNLAIIQLGLGTIKDIMGSAALKEPASETTQTKSPVGNNTRTEKSEGMLNGQVVPEEVTTSPLPVPGEVTTNEHPKSYVCPEKDCQKQFKHASNLRRHRNIHSGPKPFRCPVEPCTQEYVRAANLKNHLRRKHKMIIKNLEPEKNQTPPPQSSSSPNSSSSTDVSPFADLSPLTGMQSENLELH